MPARVVRRSLSALACCLTLGAGALAQHDPPAQPARPALEYDAPYFPGADHDPAIPSPQDILGFPAGQRAATPEEILRCLREWEGSDRLRIIEHARTYEGRPAVHAIISAPRHMARLDEIQRNRAQAADQRGGTKDGALRTALAEPGVAWLAYSIHGDETSGSDAALNLIWHLVADRSQATADLLDDLVIVIDPMMNPDGRARYLKMHRELDGVAPSTDEQSLIHNGYWPAGRTNHYLFDLNRDWIFGVHPETRGRIRAVRSWNPLLFVDAHEMGALDTYLFSPTRDPQNRNAPERRRKWSELFGREQAAAFDAYGWRYYTGEWNEGWYPGYSDAWAGFGGAVPILYEQAGVAPYGVKRPEGRTLTYREAVHKQITSSIANLNSLRSNLEAITRDWVDERAEAISADAPWADQVFAIPPSMNHDRIRRFAALMDLQGVEVRTADAAFTAGGTDRFGMEVEDHEFPAGTLLVARRQPNAALAGALLEFDPQMPGHFLERERRELLRTGGSLLYDITAWNITMLHDIEAFDITAPGVATSAWRDPATDIGVTGREAKVGWVIQGADDASVVAAAQLMERGVDVRVSNRPFTWGDHDFPRGSVIVAQIDNRDFAGDLAATVDRVARDAKVRAVATDTGFGEGDWNPDIGGEHFPLMTRPRIAVVTRDGVSPNNFGEVWFTIDHQLGLPMAQIELADLARADLRKYNLIVIPEAFGAGLAQARESLQTWVRAGGTLIAIGSAASQMASEDSGLSDTRLLRGVLEELDAYEQQVLREYLSLTETVDVASVWTGVVPTEPAYPWGEAPSRPGKEELERRDDWARSFSPQGAAMAGRVDQKSWLTAGTPERMSVLVGGSQVFMATGGVEAPVRFGIFTPAPPKPAPEGEAEEGDEGKDEKKPEAQRAGWAMLPPGMSMRLRMSGLLWPEAAGRIANGAYVTREDLGRGQVILFADSPVFRGATRGTARLLTNAIVYGPGFGGSEAVLP
jgi:hypothetical protein